MLHNTINNTIEQLLNNANLSNQPAISHESHQFTNGICTTTTHYLQFTNELDLDRVETFCDLDWQLRNELNQLLPSLPQVIHPTPVTNPTGYTPDNPAENGFEPTLWVGAFLNTNDNTYWGYSILLQTSDMAHIVTVNTYQY